MNETELQQNETHRKTKPGSRAAQGQAVRLDSDCFKVVKKLAEKANKKAYGKKVNVKQIVNCLISIADQTLLDEVVKMSQENSLRPKDEQALFEKEMLPKFKGNVAELRQEMRRIFRQYQTNGLSTLS